MAGELAVAEPEDRQVVGHLGARRLLAEAAARDVPEEELQQIGPPSQHLVMDGDGAAEPADPAGGRLLHAKQAHHIGTVGMETQGPVGESARIGRKKGLVATGTGRHLAITLPRLAPLIADLAHELPAPVLEDGPAEMAADPEPDPAQRLGRIP